MFSWRSSTILFSSVFFFFNDTATTEIYTLSLHDALPIWSQPTASTWSGTTAPGMRVSPGRGCFRSRCTSTRSEEHTSELQSHVNLVCRLLLEKKKRKTAFSIDHTNKSSRQSG